MARGRRNARQCAGRRSREHWLADSAFLVCRDHDPARPVHLVDKRLLHRALELVLEPRNARHLPARDPH
eukprot:6399651-Prymnesium_polylepis.1